MPDFPVPMFKTDCVHFTTRVVNYSPSVHMTSWYNAGTHQTIPECAIGTNNDMFRRPIATPCEGCPFYEHRVTVQARTHFRVLDSGSETWGLTDFAVRELSAAAPKGDVPYAINDLAVTEYGTANPSSRACFTNLCIDVSESVADAIGISRDSAVIWVERMWGLSDPTDPRPDLSGVFTFTEDVSQDQTLTNDRDDLIAAIEPIDVVADSDPNAEVTVMFDALIAAIADLVAAGNDGYNSVLVIGDGVDSGSTATKADVITAAGFAGVVIDAIGLEHETLVATTTLSDLASGTGGSYTLCDAATGAMLALDAIQRNAHRRYYSATWTSQVPLSAVGTYLATSDGLVATGREYGWSI